jgi:hypothetical protein
MHTDSNKHETPTDANNVLAVSDLHLKNSKLFGETQDVVDQ